MPSITSCFPANATLLLLNSPVKSAARCNKAQVTHRGTKFSGDRVTPWDPWACGAWRLTPRLDVHINQSVNLQRKSHRVTYLCDWPSVYQTGANSSSQNWNVKYLLLRQQVEGLVTFSNPHHHSTVLTAGKNSRMVMACLLPVAQFRIAYSCTLKQFWTCQVFHLFFVLSLAFW